ncbi:MAG: biotin--[acetyl-CoA-carboxylase] ligase [Thermoguttaceae bacterium]
MIDIVRVLRETFVAQAEHHPSLDSTNNRAAWCASRGPRDLPLLVVADEQTVGRGRGSKRWWTGRGCLAMSLLVDPATVAAEEGRSPLVALAAAVAVAETVRANCPNHAADIHWPNDVLVEGRKVSGILVEVLPDRRHVIGIGLNTNNHVADAPAELRATVATLCDLIGRELDQTEVLIGLLGRLDRLFRQLHDAPDAVAARANALCVQRGRNVTLRWETQLRTGLCHGIGPTGGILLETPDGVEAFYSGTTEG